MLGRVGQNGLSTVRQFFGGLKQTAGRQRSNSRRRGARGRNVPPETLEQRCLLAASSLTAADQLMLELMNRARANPSAEASRQGISLNQGLAADTISTAAKQPLAPNNLLDNAADGHTADMFARGFFRHTSPSPGSTTFDQRVTAAGYTYTVVGENLSLQQYSTLNEQTVVQQLHDGLYASPNHRVNMMDDRFHEAGNGVSFGNYTDGDGVVGGGTAPAGLVSIEFGSRAEQPFITGVVYTDATSGTNNDSFYSIGEAAGAGGTVTATNVSTNSTVTETVGAAGGYSLQVPAGTYNVTVSGGGLSKTFGVENIMVGSSNVKVDFETTTAQEASITLAAPNITTTHLTKTQDQRFTLNWDAVSGANRYEVTYTQASTNTTNYVNEFVTGTSFTPSSDLPIDRYYIWVRVAGTDGATSAWSSPITVQVNTAPTLDALDLTQTTARPTISWTAVSGADRYEVWARNATTEQGPAFNDTNVTGTSWTPSSDLPIGIYFVWVRAYDGADVVAEWSASQRFHIGPQLLSPVAPTFDTSPQFSWTAATGANTYQLYVTQGSTVVINESGIQGTTYTHTSALGSGDHRWWVRPFASNGRAGGWTEVSTFNVDGKPIITAPSGTTTSGTPTITWTAVSGAGAYEVYLYDLDSSTLVTRERGLTGTSFSAPALSNGNYRVWVKSFLSNGSDGSWSRPQDFTVSSASVTLPVTLTSPLTPVLDTTPEFQWAATSGASTYDLYLHNGTTAVLETGIAGTSFTPASALADGSWQWWVRAVNSAGAAGDWSSVGNTDVTGRPIVSAPTGTTSDTTPTFMWVEVVGAASYVIQVDNLTTGTQSFVRDDSVLATSYTAAETFTPGEYRFWIQAVGSPSSIRSPWSLTAEFTVAASETSGRATDRIAPFNSNIFDSNIETSLAVFPNEADGDIAVERSQPEVSRPARFQRPATSLMPSESSADVDIRDDVMIAMLTRGTWIDNVS